MQLRQLPYLTYEIKQLCRQRDYIKKRAIKTGSIYLWQVFRQLRNKVIYSLRNLRRDYYTRKIEENKGNLKNTWKILKHAIGKETKNVHLDKISKDGKIITDPIDIAECCNDHFASIGQRLAGNVKNTESSSTHVGEKAMVNTKFDFKLINSVEVYNKLKTLDKNKATGIHNIPNKMLLLCADIVAPHLADIFNYSSVSNNFLDDFKIGKVSPLFKNGEREDLNNYGPISVLPSIARVFEKIIYKQLLDFFNSNKLLSTKQCWFRNLHSTVLALLNSSNNWYINIDKGDTNGIIFLDIRKAFNTIDHSILLKKLSHYGVSEDSLLFIKSYLINRTQCCSVNGKLSSVRQISYGVPQGSILGPLLFIIFMNDLPNAVKSADICMYADDTSMSSTIKNTSDLETQIIPEYLNICNWLKSNKLTLNALKTEFIIMGNHQKVGTCKNNSSNYILSSVGLRIIVQIAFHLAPGPERGSSKRGCKEKSHAHVTTSFPHFFVQPYKIQMCSWYLIVLFSHGKRSYN